MTAKTKPMCGARFGEWECTRPRGHADKHACDVQGGRVRWLVTGEEVRVSGSVLVPDARRGT